MLGGATKNSQSFLNEQKVGVAFVESERFTETKFEKRQLNEFVLTSWNRLQSLCKKCYSRDVTAVKTTTAFCTNEIIWKSLRRLVRPNGSAPTNEINDKSLGESPIELRKRFLYSPFPLQQ